MFGDMGHGGLLLAFSIWLCTCKDYIIKSKSMFAMFVNFRYLLLLMGFFAFYCGTIYNEFLSIPTNVFGSCYTNELNELGELIGVREPNCVYPYGFDPKWYIATNELVYMNSYKMKLAVTLGVS